MRSGLESSSYLRCQEHGIILSIISGMNWSWCPRYLCMLYHIPRIRPHALGFDSDHIKCRFRKRTLSICRCWVLAFVEVADNSAQSIFAKFWCFKTSGTPFPHPHLLRWRRSGCLYASSLLIVLSFSHYRSLSPPATASICITCFAWFDHPILGRIPAWRNPKPARFFHCYIHFVQVPGRP